MRKNPHDIILEGKSKKQHLSIVLKSYPIYIYNMPFILSQIPLNHAWTIYYTLNDNLLNVRYHINSLLFTTTCNQLYKIVVTKCK